MGRWRRRARGRGPDPINDTSNAVAGAFDAATWPLLKRLNDPRRIIFEARSRWGVSMMRLSWQWIYLAGHVRVLC